VYRDHVRKPRDPLLSRYLANGRIRTGIEWKDRMHFDGCPDLPTRQSRTSTNP